MNQSATTIFYAAALALGLSLVIATAFHATHMICEGDWTGDATRGEAMLRGFAGLVRSPLHLMISVLPLWIGWTLLLLSAADRAIPPVVGLGTVLLSMLGTLFFYAFAVPRIDCATFSDRAMIWRISGLFLFVAFLLLLPRLWRRG
ncbi:MAG: hypothetical protein H5U24_00115 [Thioclava marina]|uniref:DUF1772 domain-containing protein n=1 Tax=Thioclava marina TaxID=1915077 RepID=A0ABX3MLB5_9RHOB|nr:MULTISPECIES: hypothetical protein [Thioclava]TNE83797.1 MAG: hypothetical protein EP337_14820 [Paracoccaceae bacterium]MBC7143788.1 hypothetical protein [Thioclava marina]MBD3802652.1 hypothetical protein [Thioclava sp.]OOY12354.1 hypothetical protein BMG00_00340 [Thioclava marina]OOY28316.1 hypothetical protein BMI90_06405 [Thioclava sp. L04-15]